MRMRVSSGNAKHKRFLESRAAYASLKSRLRFPRPANRLTAPVAPFAQA